MRGRKRFRSAEFYVMRNASFLDRRMTQDRALVELNQIKRETKADREADGSMPPHIARLLEWLDT